MLLSVTTLALTACGGGSASGDKTNAGNNPELQKPALRVTKETETCTFESTDFQQDVDGDNYYTFSRGSHKAVRIVTQYENNVRRQVTESFSERSTCLSYQDHCNQSWSTDKMKSNSDSVMRVSIMANGVRQESSETTMTITLLATTDEDKSEVNKPEVRKMSGTTLERVDGNKRYLIEESYAGGTIKYNENYVTEVNETETSRTENEYLLKPIKFSDSDGTTTMIKSSSNCTAQIETVRN